MEERGGGDVLRRNMLVLAWLALVATSLAADATEAQSPGTRTAEPAPHTDGSGPRPFVLAESCVSKCQAQHDRCRVATKGSRSCDEERQRCLEACLQKKRK
ncbi:MAG: hypothetical protein R3D44_01295 [Hyphomicrobiaceae bacterium]